MPIKTAGTDIDTGLVWSSAYGKIIYLKIKIKF